MSVVVCTLNRRGPLEKTLESLAKQQFARSAFEVVVVDNGSTDGTQALLEHRSQTDSNLRYVDEARKGLSVARNEGVTHARGEVIAFIDDDALASSSWLESVWCAFAREPDAWAVGGPVELVWPSSRPAWLPASLEEYFSRLDLGTLPRWFDSGRFPFGTNMAVRRTAFERVGGFSPLLGRVGSNLLSHEEREFFIRIRRLGGRMFYEPKAVVHHVVADERLKRSWILKRAYAGGKSKAVADALQDSRPRSYWVRAALKFLLAALPFATLGLLRGLVRREGQKALTYEGVRLSRGIAFALGSLRNAVGRISEDKSAAA